MIFINNNADYSNVRIGIMDIPYYDSDAERILSNYTKQITSKVRHAFNKFVIDMKEAGMWSKVNNLFVPILAGTKQEFFYNAITNTGVDYETSALTNFGVSKYGASSKYASTSSETYTVPNIDIELTRTLVSGSISRISNNPNTISQVLEANIQFCLGVGYSPASGGPASSASGGNTSYQSSGVNSLLVYMGPTVGTFSVISGTLRTIKNQSMVSSGFASSSTASSKSAIKIRPYIYQNGNSAYSVCNNSSVSILFTLAVEEYSDAQLMAVNKAVQNFETKIYENDATTFEIIY